MENGENFLENVDNAFGKMGVFIFDHRKLVLFLVILFLCMCLYFASLVRIDNSYESFFADSDDTYLHYLNYQEDFGADEVAYILYSATDKKYGPFNIEVMRKIAHLTEALENEVPFVREVTSLTNAEFMEASGDFIEINELGLDFPETQEALLKRRDRMMKKPIFINSLFNDDASHAAIFLEMNLTSSDTLDKLRLDPEGGDSLQNLYPQVSNSKINEILSRPEYQGITFYKGGDVPMNSAYNEIIDYEMGVQTLLSFLIVGIISLVFFKMKLSGLTGPLLVVILGLLFVVGFMGMMGYTIGIAFLIIPTLFTAIGVAQSVHVIAEYRNCQSKGMEKREAVREALSHVGVPCFLAALTTAAGFFAMVVSKLEVIANLAVYSAAGVMMVFVFSVTVLILVLTLGREAETKSNKTHVNDQGPLSRILKWVLGCNLKYPRLIIFISSVIFIVAFMGIYQLKIGFNFLEEFKKKTTFYQEVNYIENVMGGLLNVVYIFDAESPEGIKDPEVLKLVERLQAEADQNPLVKKSYSIVDILKDVNQTFNNGDPAYNKLPENKELISQYLLLYEMAGGKELEDYVSGDYQRTTLELRVAVTDSYKIEALLNDLDSWLKQNPMKGVQVNTTGIGLLWIQICDYISDSQITGYTLAFIMIAFLMCLVFRSVKVGLISMIPNLSPVILTLGIMGWLDVHLDYFRLLLATVAIGIAVDDTVHLLTRINKEYNHCRDYTLALERSLFSVGRALIITSVVLFLAFLVFLSSSLVPVSSFGLFLAITISTALIADLFLLPALILVFKPFGEKITDNVNVQQKKVEAV